MFPHMAMPMPMESLWIEVLSANELKKMLENSFLWSCIIVEPGKPIYEYEIMISEIETEDELSIEVILADSVNLSIQSFN